MASTLDRLLRTALSDPARLETIAASGLLAAPPDGMYEWMTGLVQTCLAVPVSFVTLVTGDRQVFLGQRDLPEPWRSISETSLPYSFCQYVVGTQATLRVDDAAAHPIGAANLAVQDFGVGAYLGAPIRSPEGHVLGAICAFDGEPRAWTDRDVEMLRQIATGVELNVAARLTGGASEPSEAALA